MYLKVNGNGHLPDVQTVDLRSDTVSQPTNEMREAMANAVVGDDVYEEDPTVKELERKSAELLGKEDALFVASGTMANLIATMVHCHRRGSEMIAGDKGHTFRFEQGNAAQLAGVQTALIPNNDDGTFDLDQLREKIRVNPDCHEPYSDLIVVENTHNMCGGKVLPLDWLEKVQNIAREHNIKVHMDGARIFNAAVQQKIPAKEITKYVDTVCFCVSKGLCAPIGSVLAGPKDFIAQARRTRKAVGGAWRQAGFLAAAGLVAIDKMIDRLQEDHDHTYKIAKAIDGLKSKTFRVDLKSVETNILVIYVDRTIVLSTQVIERLATVLPTDVVRVSVMASALFSHCIRLVLYHQITDDDVDAAIEKIVFVFTEMENGLNKKCDIY